MERNLQEWLDLSMRRNMPTSLLLLSRAFTVTTRTSKLLEEELKATLGSLPDEAVEDVSIQLPTEYAFSPSPSHLGLIPNGLDLLPPQKLPYMSDRRILH